MPNRFICDVLEELRACYETRNFSYMLGLIEEAQSLANRMEAGLGDKKDLKELKQERDELVDEIKSLKLKKGKETKSHGKTKTL